MPPETSGDKVSQPRSPHYHSLGGLRSPGYTQVAGSLLSLPLVEIKLGFNSKESQAYFLREDKVQESIGTIMVVGRSERVREVRYREEIQRQEISLLGIVRERGVKSVSRDQSRVQKSRVRDQESLGTNLLDDKGVNIESKYFSHPKFADNIIFLKATEEPERMPNDLNEASQKVGLTMNISETKIMRNEYVDEEDPDQTVTVHDTAADEIDHYTCLR
nr:uncharacterized protein LOC113803680 [Penaeus vannamei]